MDLLLLAPDIQEEVLFLAQVEEGRDAVTMRELMRVSVAPTWRQQRAAWGCLRPRAAA